MNVVYHLLLPLPSSFDNALTAIETLSLDKLKINFIKSRLLDDEEKHKNQEFSSIGEVAFITDKETHQIRYYKWGELNHKRPNCPKFKVRKKK